MRIGFSTGSIAHDDVRRGLLIGAHRRAKATELSALREHELDPLLNSLDHLKQSLQPFEYVSFHAPSSRKHLSEATLVAKLQQIADRGWPIITHPDIIQDFSLWRKLGRAVCIENMDKRRKVGRTAEQIKKIFEQLPEATFCFDIGHARQIDPTMQEAEEFLRSFKNRLRQIHMSYVNSSGGHERLNRESIMAFRRLAGRIDEATPVILETPVLSDEIDEEIDAAEEIFAALSNSGVDSNGKCPSPL